MINQEIRKTFPILALVFIANILFSCSTYSETTQPNVSSPNLLPVQCKQMAPMKDIWVLEPSLVKKGKIKENMTNAEKEKVIRHFIRNKTKQYEICLKSKK